MLGVFAFRERLQAKQLTGIALAVGGMLVLIEGSLNGQHVALTSLASFVSQGMTFVALPFLFQSVYGYSALHAALLFTAWPV
ncbi:hypothetical protein ACLD4N_23640, partial [Cronobacter sakazakii]